MYPDILNWDEVVFQKIHAWHHPLADHFFSLITHRFFGILLGSLSFFLLRKDKKRIWLFAITITLSDQCSASLLQPLCKRYRPCYALDHLPIHLVGSYRGKYGFPSAHASNGFAFSMLFWLMFRKRYRFTYLFFIIACTIAYGRVYGGMHYPLDVIGGAILGSAIGLLSYRVCQKNQITLIF